MDISLSLSSPATPVCIVALEKALKPATHSLGKPFKSHRNSVESMLHFTQALRQASSAARPRKVKQGSSTRKQQQLSGEAADAARQQSSSEPSDSVSEGLHPCETAKGFFQISGTRVGEVQSAKRSSQQCHIRKFIFLDVDGVLHDAHYAPKPFRHKCMQALSFLVRSTNAGIVLSSTWRLTLSGRQAVEKALSRYDLPPMLGITATEETSRGKSIKAWITDNTKGSEEVRFIALDDMDLSLDIAPHMVLTRTTGMRWRDALIGIAILNNETLPVFSDSSDSGESSSTEVSSLDFSSRASGYSSQ